VSLVGSCSGTCSEADLWGTFVPFGGDCGDLTVNGGRQSYFNELTQYYLYFFAGSNEWVVSNTCGSHLGTSASGSAGTYPFLSPASTWDCSEGGEFVSKNSSVVCSRYASEPEACIEGTYEESGTAAGGECAGACPPELPFSSPGATSLEDCTLPPEACQEISLIGSCTGQEAEIMFQGVFEVFDGDCPGAGGERAWFNSQTLEFFYFVVKEGTWAVGRSCGAEDTRSAYGTAIDKAHPFLDAPPSWQCADHEIDSDTPDGAFVTGLLRITCSHFEGRTRACQPGSFEASGVAPDGMCSGVCPPHLPTSFLGSKSLEACMTLGANLLAVSMSGDRVLEFDPDESNFRTRVDEGFLEGPGDVVCVSELRCIISGYESSKVKVVNLRGEDQGVFAVLGNPYGLLYVPDLNLVVVCVVANDAVLVFDAQGYELLGRPLQVSQRCPIKDVLTN
jgi:hypothetical protein